MLMMVVVVVVIVVLLSYDWGGVCEHANVVVCTCDCIDDAIGFDLLTCCCMNV
jgi:hypothetical protein